MAIKKEKLHAKGLEIAIYTEDFREEYISLTDIAKYRNADDPRFIIQNWMRSRDVIDFLGIWECLHNPDFNRVNFEAVKNEAGYNRFVMTPTKTQLSRPYRCHQAESRHTRTHARTEILRLCR